MENIMRVKPVGTFTLGITLILTGIAFMIQMVEPIIITSIIIRCWPAIFILLGGEILYASHKSREEPVSYDKAGIFLTACMMIFAMILAVLSACTQQYIQI